MSTELGAADGGFDGAVVRVTVGRAVEIAVGVALVAWDGDDDGASESATLDASDGACVGGMLATALGELVGSDDDGAMLGSELGAPIGIIDGWKMPSTQNVPMQLRTSPTPAGSSIAQPSHRLQRVWVMLSRAYTLPCGAPAGQLWLCVTVST